MGKEDRELKATLEATWRWPVALVVISCLAGSLALQPSVDTDWRTYGMVLTGLAWLGQAVINYQARRSSLFIIGISGFTILLLEKPLQGNLELALLFFGSILVVRRFLIFAVPFWLVLYFWQPWKEDFTGSFGDSLILLSGLLMLYVVKVELDRWRYRSLEEKKLYATNERRLHNQNTHLENLGLMVSHNVRAPLQGIKMLVQMMPEMGKAEKKELQQKIFGAIEEIQTMVIQLNTMLKQHAEAREQLDCLELSEIWETTKGKLQGLIASSRADLKADFSEFPQITLPRIYLESIFLNLTSNAIKYSQEGREPNLRVRSFREGDFAIIEFADQGRGINMEEEGQLLFKWHCPTTQKGESQSTGLFISKNHVELLGGKLLVDSQVGQGSTFWIQIPIDA